MLCLHDEARMVEDGAMKRKAFIRRPPRVAGASGRRRRRINLVGLNRRTGGAGVGIGECKRQADRLRSPSGVSGVMAVAMAVAMAVGDGRGDGHCRHHL